MKKSGKKREWDGEKKNRKISREREKKRKWKKGKHRVRKREGN